MTGRIVIILIVFCLWSFRIERFISQEKSPLLSCGHLKFIRPSKTGLSPFFCHSDKMPLAFFSWKRWCLGPVFSSPQMPGRSRSLQHVSGRSLTHPTLAPVILSAFDPSPCFNIQSLCHTHNAWEYQVTRKEQNQRKKQSPNPVSWLGLMSSPLLPF